TADTYENRLVKSYHDEVAQRLRRIGAAFQASNVPNALLEARQLGDALRRARKAAPFLDEVRQSDFLPTKPTMVLLKRHAYRAVLENYLEFRRAAFVQLDEAALDAPLENLPGLYEVWGTLRVIQALLEVGAELGYTYRTQQLARPSEGAL